MNIALSRQLVLHPRFRWSTGMMAIPFPNREQGFMPDLDDQGTMGILLSYLREADPNADLAHLSTTVAPGDSIAMRLLSAWGPS